MGERTTAGKCDRDGFARGHRRPFFLRSTVETGTLDELTKSATGYFG